MADLTPIHIVGKNKMDQSKAAVAQRKAMGRLPGRPLKLDAFPTPTQKTQEPQDTQDTPARKKSRKKKYIKAPEDMCSLEKLPTELLEEVFLYAQNLSLPLSSPVIATKLSSEAIYVKTVIQAFGLTWEHGYGRYQHVGWDETVEPWSGPNYRRARNGTLGEGVVVFRGHVMENLQNEVLVADEKVARQWVDWPDSMLGSLRADEINWEPVGGQDFQSMVLRFRWASLPVLLKSRATWLQKFTPPDRVFRRITLREGVCAREKYPNPFKLLEDDYAELDPLLNGLNDNTTIRTSTSWISYADVGPGVEIPRSLLVGPWDEEMTKRLYWLVKNNAQIDWISSTSGELAMEGLHKAMSDGNLKIMHLLMWAGLTENLTIDHFEWALNNVKVNNNGVKVIHHLIMYGLVKKWGEYRVTCAWEAFALDAETGNDLAKKALKEALEKRIPGWIELHEPPVEEDL